MRRRRGPRLMARGSFQESLEALRSDAAQHGADQHAHHVAHEGVRLDPEGEQLLALLNPCGALDIALEAHVICVARRKGREVARADKRGSACIERRPVANVSPDFRLTPIWFMPAIWYSTGSSIVMMFFSTEFSAFSAA